MVRTSGSCTGTAGTRDTRLRAVSIAAVLAMVAAVVLVGPSGTARAATKVNLGTAGSFAVLAGTTITNTGPTTITGDVGLHPGKAVTGFNSVTLHGQLHVANATASQAKDDLELAYDIAAGQQPRTTVATELGGQVLPGGVYTSADGTFGITDTLTLDAQNDPDTVWIFQAASTLTTATDSSVSLINGADACNVFWQVGSSATLGTRTSFAGNILALSSVSLKTSATIQGRALARNGAVTMDTNTITRANCTTATTPSPSPSPTPSPTPTASPSPTEVAVPADSTTGTTDESTGTPTAAGTPDAPVAAAPPTSGTPQVTTVPTGSVSAGDGSMAINEEPERATAALVLAPLFAALVLYATWRRRKA